MTNRSSDSQLLAAGVTLVLIALSALSIFCLQPGPALPANADPSRFSAERAMAHVTAIAAEPRPSGSPGHARAREYIVETLRGLGLEPEIRAAQASSTRYGLPFDSASVRNVVAAVRGTAPARTIVLACHYDTMPTSPGAGDDGAGVAALLETARAVTLGPPPRHDLVFLFTDAEEIGALGGEQYVADGISPAETIVLNFDARGAGGPCGLIQTGPASGALVRALGRVGNTPTASSLVPALSRAHGVGTDFRPFRDAGATGLNFAFVDKVAYYHTPADDAGTLDARSLQQQGDIALGLARTLGDAPTLDASDVVYFPLPGWGLLWFPSLLNIPFAIVATGAFAWLAWRTSRKSRLRDVYAAAALALVALLAAGVAAQATWWIARALDPTTSALRSADTYDPSLYRVAVTLAAAAASLACFGVMRRRISPDGWALGVGALWVAVMWVSVVFTPGASYVFVLPLPVVCLVVTALSRAEPMSPAIRAGAVLIAAVPVLLLWAPIAYFLFVGFQLSASPFVGALVAFAALPVCVTLDAARLFPRWWTVVGMAAAAIGIAAAGLYGAGFDDGRPRPVSLAYAEDAESGLAFWIAERESDDAVTAALFAREVEPTSVPLLFGDAPTIRRAGEAASLGVPGPQLTLISDVTNGERRTMRFRARSRRGAPWLFVFLDSTARVLGTSIDGVAVSGDAVTSAPPEGIPWSFRHIGLQAEGIEWELTLEATAEPVRVVVTDQSSGVPTPDGGPLQLPANTMFARSWVAGTTLARSSYTF